MPVPDTYLLTVPDIKVDPFGRCISSTEMVRKLKKINPLILCADTFSSSTWYPGKSLGGTCLWYGGIGGTNRKITAFRHGPIPEWTQLDEKGEIITRGWRDIFKRVVGSKSARALDIEKSFGIDLGVDGLDSFCSWCRKSNKKIKATSASGYCDMHERVRLTVEKARQFKQERLYQRRIS